MIPLLATISRAIAGDAGSWTPAEITTDLWLDAEDASTITVESGTVEQWNDKSTNNRHVARVSVDTGPTVAAAELNGLDVLNFVDDYLKGTAFSHPEFYIISAVRFSGPANINNGNCVFCDGNNLSFGLSNGVRFDNFNGQARFGSGSSFNTATATSTGWKIHGGEYDGANSALFLDGVSVSSSAKTGNTSSITPTFAIGRFQENVSGQVDDKPANIQLAELIVYSNKADRQKLEGYLAHRWGLEGNLDAGHPYKAAPPTV